MEGEGLELGASWVNLTRTKRWTASRRRQILEHRLGEAAPVPETKGKGVQERGRVQEVSSWI